MRAPGVGLLMKMCQCVGVQVKVVMFIVADGSVDVYFLLM